MRTALPALSQRYPLLPLRLLNLPSQRSNQPVFAAPKGRDHHNAGAALETRTAFSKSGAGA